MRLMLTAIILLITLNPVYAQPDSLWSRTFDGDDFDEATSLIQTADGGFALAGYTFSFGACWADFWLVRTDENGDSLWSRTFGGSRDDEASSLIQTADGGFAMAGYTWSFGAGSTDFWLMKTGPDPANAVWEVDSSLPSVFTLFPAYPNPFNARASITYSIPKPSHIRLSIHDLQGREVAVLHEGMSNPGVHTHSWDASGLPSGLYICRMETSEKTASIKLAMVR